MSRSHRVQRIIRYGHPELDVAHEVWLLEWCLDWFGHATPHLSISRFNEGDQFCVEISIDTTADSEECNRWSEDLIANLETEVDLCQVDCILID